MLPNSEEEEKKVEFYSLSEKRFYYISIPEIRGWRCCGSFNNGWLMMINPNLEIRLFHPWRKTHLKLPHYSTLYPKGFTQPYISGRENISILKAAMSDDAAVVVILYQGGRPAYCRTREN
ncbi:hypothetical protein MRB53_018695 [Persea americana]|uniref:Uncharacterized protein n=1 Tax=Persea americana TaxID=3435 RepID=A0ACC2M8Q5_PERAE|nr:hypothetical protein MRB53_018695 [Persea americana]